MDQSLQEEAAPRTRWHAPPLEPSLGAAFDAAPERFHAKGAVLAEAGRPLAHWQLVREGWACRQRAFGGGATAILELYLPGDIVGPEAALAEPLEESVVALTPLRVSSVPAAAARALTETAEGRQSLAAHLDRKRRWAETLAVAIAHLDARGRVALLLAELGRRQGDAPRHFRLPLTQRQIGSCLGITPIHVNRTLRQLREMGVATVEGKVATILDRDRLLRLARGQGTPAATRQVRPTRQ